MYKYTITTSNRIDGVKEDIVIAGSVHYGQDWIKFYTENRADRELNSIFSVRANEVISIRSEVEATDYEKNLRKTDISNVPVPDSSWFTREDLDREIRHLRELFESQLANLAKDLESSKTIPANLAQLAQTLTLKLTDVEKERQKLEDKVNNSRDRIDSLDRLLDTKMITTSDVSKNQEKRIIELERQVHDIQQRAMITDKKDNSIDSSW